LFIACENKGIIHFLSSNDTLGQSIAVMKSCFQDEVDKMRNRDFVLASRLSFNQGYLTVGGDNNLTKKDFIVILNDPS